MTIYLLALLLGVVAGLRAFTAPAAASWAAYLALRPVQGTALSFMGAAVTAIILTLLACAELVADKRPGTPSRKAPLAFGGRLVTGALAGATIGMGSGLLLPGLALGGIGAVIGTLGGAAARSRLAAAMGRDWPAAVIEDVVAVGGSALMLAVLA